MEKLKLFEKQNVSLYQVQKELGYAIQTLYRYARNERKIENMPGKMLVELAKYFKMEPEKLYVEIQKYQKQLGGKNEQVSTLAKISKSRR